MRKLLLSMVLIIWSISSFAGLMIEPSIGYLDGSMDTKTTLAGQNLEYGVTGTEFGAKVGYSFLGLNLGASYFVASTDFAVDQPSNSGLVDVGFDSTKMGVFAGFNFPVLLRVWGIYHLSSEYEESIGDKDLLSGKGYTLGLGLTPIPIPLPFLSLSFNLEYTMINLDEGKDGVTGTISTIDYDVQEIKLSVSTPLNF